ncbi:hypothetical protein ES703_88202 [subsurface metagenome]
MLEKVLLYSRGALRAEPGIKAYLADITYIVRPKIYPIDNLHKVMGNRKATGGKE